jgi:hypothetical protein
LYNKTKNAHGTEVRELLYRWHPWFGLRVGVHESIKRPDGVVFRCELEVSEANRWLEIPAWMFDRTACARVRLAAHAHADLSALIALGALLQGCCTTALQRRMPPNRAYQISLAIGIGERPMAQQSKRKTARRHVPQQIDLFGEEPQTIGDMPAWSGLPTEIRAALTALMTQLILDHADQRADRRDEGGRL